MAQTALEQFVSSITPHDNRPLFVDDLQAVLELLYEGRAITISRAVEILNEKVVQRFKAHSERYLPMERERLIEARQDGHESTTVDYGEAPWLELDIPNEQWFNETYGTHEP